MKGAATVISGATTTAHNCYGVGTADCAEADLLNDRKPLNWELVYKPKDASDVVMPDNDKLIEME